ncbi:MAG: hypothetical protein KF740_06900 [Ramlibacter sp.]|nr:hypothetical protein [Ramlibacter sp.]
MTAIFQVFEANAAGAWLLLAYIGAGVLVVQWLAWIFGVGRFKAEMQAPRRATTQNLRYLVTEALTKIINDFRHLLALLIVMIFGLALAYSLYQSSGNMDEIKEALQAVAATLGGLVGSIIGYYFGESKAISDANSASPPPVTPAAAVVAPPVDPDLPDDGIRAVARPPDEAVALDPVAPAPAPAPGG